MEMAHDLLARHGGLAGLLGLGLHDWAACAGLGPARACQLWASLELARRVRRGRDAPRLGSPQAVGAHLLPSSLGWTEERFGLLVLPCVVQADVYISAHPDQRGGGAGRECTIR